MFYVPRFFHSQHESLAGLDIEASEIRMVELSRSHNGIVHLECAAAEPLPQGAIVDQRISNPEQVVLALKRLWKTSRTRTTRVAMGLPANAIISRKIRLPAGLTEEHMELQVENEAHRFLPFGPEEICLDFEVSAAAPDANGECEIKLAAARREQVAERTALARAANLDAVIVDCDSYAALNALMRLPAAMRQPKAERHPTVLLQLGSHSAQILLLQGESILHERELEISSAHLTRQLMERYGYLHHEARLGQTTNVLPDDYENALLQPFIALAAREVRQALQLCENATGSQSIQRIFLAGETATLPGMATAMSDSCGIPAALVDPFEGMLTRSSTVIPAAHEQASAYLVACGLALRRFD
ncbi:type IV pilus assembly protein PilM [Herbaspirillum sp. RTI4]|uniref:type IV pilus assembly protein PilM n=1 Tax=Herbaspirillum sp. RTI4 TaxID=3048640 RepID=UPI002AB3B03D|nr:type IV pilus assembly protein PilM [Herbaspirillum sp. RTI4]MDY7576871.1 type IV pilus assembly protein PilM [Herbaspirillum sp. RTI4]MEA9982522.1 type IV pilus assembly protein PilM [Herbaspirillum sp. RTI4]